MRFGITVALDRVSIFLLAQMVAVEENYHFTSLNGSIQCLAMIIVATAAGDKSIDDSTPIADLQAVLLRKGSDPGPLLGALMKTSTFR